MSTKQYNDIVLVSLFVVYGIAVLLALIASLLSTAQSPHFGLFLLGYALFYAETLVILAVDVRGCMTLKGLKLFAPARPYAGMDGQGAGGWVVAVLIGYLLAPYVMLPVYLARAVGERRQARLRQRKELLFKIAEQEAELGMLPPAMGTCHNCKEPLQAGAEYCEYCGAPTVEHSKVCPACATLAFPDAKWCPKCRTRLEDAD